MKCADPFVMTGGRAFSCGKCLPCLKNRRSIWAHRIMLEAQLHSVNAFVTLSYEDASMPMVTNSTLGTLMPRDLQLWLKRFRKRVNLPLRYYAVGEYGAVNWRPHYHVAVFGFPSCLDMLAPNVVRYGCECLICSVVRDTWGLGFVSVGSLTEASAAYIAGYISAKVKHRLEDDLCGRTPEFARMSLRPGIGRSYLARIARVVPTSVLDAPGALRYGGSMQRPLGRYLQRSLRKDMGREQSAPVEVQLQQQEKMLAVRMDARASSEDPGIKSRIREAEEGAVASLKWQMANKRR